MNITLISTRHKLQVTPRQLLPEGVIEDGSPRPRQTYVFPEMHAARIYDRWNGIPIITTLGGTLRWEVLMKYRTFTKSRPKPIEISFTPVSNAQPLTEYKPHVYAATRSYFFGQPTFIQSPVFPRRDGASAMLLCCIESGWGDTGNENVFLALDHRGIPAGLYHERSSM